MESLFFQSDPYIMPKIIYWLNTVFSVLFSIIDFLHDPIVLDSIPKVPWSSLIEIHKNTSKSRVANILCNYYTIKHKTYASCNFLLLYLLIIPTLVEQPFSLYYIKFLLYNKSLQILPSGRYSILYV